MEGRVLPEHIGGEQENQDRLHGGSSLGSGRVSRLSLSCVY